MKNPWKIKSWGFDTINSYSSKWWPWNSWSNLSGYNQVWFLLITSELIRRCLPTLNLHLIRNIWEEGICISFKSHYVMRIFEVMKDDIYYKIIMHHIEINSHQKLTAADLGACVNWWDTVTLRGEANQNMKHKECKYAKSEYQRLRSGRLIYSRSLYLLTKWRLFVENLTLE